MAWELPCESWEVSELPWEAWEQAWESWEPMGGFRGMGGFRATMGGMGEPWVASEIPWEVMSFGSLMGEMGAPPGDMGGRMASGVPHMPLHDAVGDSANTVRVPDDDEALENREEEEEEPSSEEDEDDVA